MSAPRKPRSLGLPFVADLAPKAQAGSKRRCFWAVQPTGDYNDDCRTGHQFGIEYVRFVAKQRSDGHTGVLLQIVMDMPREHSGVELGFFEIIDIAASRGLFEAERVFSIWEQWRQDGMPGVYCKEGGA
jgi:hypothetical protein